MKAFLIDPFKQEVSVVEFTGNYKNIYTHIQCRVFTACAFDQNGDTVWVDDEGLLKDLTQQAFFLIAGYPQPLAGRGLVLGAGAEGESIAPVTSLEDIKSRVKFLSLYEAQMWAGTYGHAGVR